jgi:hypothetical protein
MWPMDFRRWPLSAKRFCSAGTAILKHAQISFCSFSVRAAGNTAHADPDGRGACPESDRPPPGDLQVLRPPLPALHRHSRLLRGPTLLARHSGHRIRVPLFVRHRQVFKSIWKLKMPTHPYPIPVGPPLYIPSPSCWSTGQVTHEN